MSKTVKFFIFFIMFSLFSNSLSAQSFGYKGYSGGMMVHSGFLKSQSFSIISTDGSLENSYQQNGMPRGIGGLIKVHFGTDKNQLRVGTGGYSSSLKYSPNPSHSSVSFAFGQLEYAYIFNKINPIVGADFGGGSVKNFIMPDVVADDFVEDDNMAYRKYKYIAIVPYIGAEFKITSSLYLLCKADYNIPLMQREADYPSGSRVYVGFLFVH